MFIHNQTESVLGGDKPLPGQGYTRAYAYYSAVVPLFDPRSLDGAFVRMRSIRVDDEKDL